MGIIIFITIFLFALNMFLIRGHVVLSKRIKNLQNHIDLYMNYKDSVNSIKEKEFDAKIKKSEENILNVLTNKTFNISIDKVENLSLNEYDADILRRIFVNSKMLFSINELSNKESIDQRISVSELESLVNILIDKKILIEKNKNKLLEEFNNGGSS